jgi:soluble lytic murein transglycosylase-like protein
MAKSHPALSYDHAASRPAFRARNTLVGLVLLASIASLAVFMHSPAGSRVSMLLSPTLSSLGLLRLPLNPVAPAPVKVNPDQEKYRVIGQHLARRFNVSVDMTTNVVAKAHDVGQELKLDPILILAVIAVESRFNPIAESAMGAKGLMQVIPRFHPDKFGPLGGEQVAFEPAANITVGAKILQEYLRRTGDLSDALQMYVGASNEENGNGYAGKVMAERERLQGVLRQYQVRAQVRTASLSPQSQARPAAPAI